MNTDPEKKLFKDWFDAEAARMLGDQIHGTWPEFPVKHFESLAAKNLADLEFHGRVHQFADALATCLPEDVSAALKILRNSLPPLKADNEPMNDGWLQWPVGHFIELQINGGRYGRECVMLF